MSSIGTGYDTYASQFSPDGRIFQIEYAAKAVENSGTAIGLRCKDGIVFGAEKLVTSKLHEDSSNKRLFTVDRHIGMCVSGLIADSRRLVKVAREEAGDYRFDKSEPIPVKHLVDRVSGVVHLFTLHAGVRPFGCSVMFGTYDMHSGAQLHLVEPSGVCWGYFGCAVGKAKQAAKTEIEKLKMSDMTCRDLVKEVAKIIHTVHDEVKDKEFVLEMSWVGEVTGGKHQWVPEDVKAEAEQYAKETLKDSDSEDDD